MRRQRGSTTGQAMSPVTVVGSRSSDGTFGMHLPVKKDVLTSWTTLREEGNEEDRGILTNPRGKFR